MGIHQLRGPGGHRGSVLDSGRWTPRWGGGGPGATRHAGAGHDPVLGPPAAPAVGTPRRPGDVAHHHRCPRQVRSTATAAARIVGDDLIRSIHQRHCGPRIPGLLTRPAPRGFSRGAPHWFAIRRIRTGWLLDVEESLLNCRSSAAIRAFWASTTTQSLALSRRSSQASAHSCPPMTQQAPAAAPTQTTMISTPTQ
jgi:hypothetical protein